MSRLCSVTLYGDIYGSNAYESLFSFIKKRHGSVDFGGYVNGAVAVEDGMDFLSTPVNDSDPFLLAKKLLSCGRLSTIDCYWVIDGNERYFNCDAGGVNGIEIMLNANRVTLADGTIDFNWYYKHLVMELANEVIQVIGVSFSDCF